MPAAPKIKPTNPLIQILLKNGRVNKIVDLIPVNETDVVLVLGRTNTEQEFYRNIRSPNHPSRSGGLKFVLVGLDEGLKDRYTKLFTLVSPTKKVIHALGFRKHKIITTQ